MEHWRALEMKKQQWRLKEKEVDGALCGSMELTQPKVREKTIVVLEYFIEVIISDFPQESKHVIGFWRLTWFHHEQSGRSITNRLDRVLSYCNWRRDFPEAYVENLTKLHSDHCLLLVRCGGGLETVVNMPFSFQAAWASHENFHDVVLQAWSSIYSGVFDR
ncbi:hypothetical protein Lal_00042620 [Lupinus albus]|nr:hypothetical protein Lal_00042620 [Lupinus albus]